MIPMWIRGLSRECGIEIKRIRLNNSGENRNLQKECGKQNLGVIFEFAAPGTPQENSVVERKILFKTTTASMKFDRMIPSGSSWLMAIKVQWVMDHAHSAIEPGKRITMSKFHEITGHTGEHLLRPTAKYMKIELTGKLAPCEICAQAQISQVNISKKQ